MTLFGVCLFLRGDETMNLGFFSLIEENAICNNNGMIAGLFAHILGKTEKQQFLPPVTMMLWAMPTHPWSCPVKHLLLLVLIGGHNNGCFFVNNDTMMNIGTSTNNSNFVLESIKHPTFLEYFQCFFVFSCQP